MSHMPMAMSVFLLEMALLPYPTQVPPSQGTIKSCAAAMSAVTVVHSMKSSAKDSINGITSATAPFAFALAYSHT